MMKRKDECLFCKSRSCYTRIYRTADEKGPGYDEIACDKHIHDLEKHSDEVLGSHNGVMRLHMSSTARHKRKDIDVINTYEKLAAQAQTI